MGNQNVIITLSGPVIINDNIFNGTLFETELIMDNDGKWFLLICDIYSYRGSNVFTKQITERMNLTNDIFMNEYINDSSKFQ